MTDSAQSADALDQCEWCREPVHERVAVGPHGEVYCSEVCAENIDREVRYVD